MIEDPPNQVLAALKHGGIIPLCWILLQGPIPSKHIQVVDELWTYSIWLDILWTAQKISKEEDCSLIGLFRHCIDIAVPGHSIVYSAYVSVVRSLLDYGSIIWDPYLKQDIDKLERVQRQASPQASRFVTGDYKTREGCVTRMLETLELSSLEQRRSSNRLVFLYKVVEEGLVPAVFPDVFLKPKRPK